MPSDHRFSWQKSGMEQILKLRISESALKVKNKHQAMLYHLYIAPQAEAQGSSPFATHLNNLKKNEKLSFQKVKTQRNVRLKSGNTV